MTETLYLTGGEFCKSSSLLEVAEESCFMSGQCSQNARAQKTLRSPACYARLCPGDLRIFLATRLSHAAVAFFCGCDEKLLRCGKLATSYNKTEASSIPPRAPRSRLLQWHLGPGEGASLYTRAMRSAPSLPHEGRVSVGTLMIVVCSGLGTLAGRHSAVSVVSHDDTRCV